MAEWYNDDCLRQPDQVIGRLEFHWHFGLYIVRLHSYAFENPDIGTMHVGVSLLCFPPRLVGMDRYETTERRRLGVWLAALPRSEFTQFT